MLLVKLLVVSTLVNIYSHGQGTPLRAGQIPAFQPGPAVGGEAGKQLRELPAPHEACHVHLPNCEAMRSSSLSFLRESRCALEAMIEECSSVLTASAFVEMRTCTSTGQLGLQLCSHQFSSQAYMMSAPCSSIAILVSTRSPTMRTSSIVSKADYGYLPRAQNIRAMILPRDRRRTRVVESSAFRSTMDSRCSYQRSASE
jgi:hypothetical protein